MIVLKGIYIIISIVIIGSILMTLVDDEKSNKIQRMSCIIAILYAVIGLILTIGA